MSQYIANYVDLPSCRMHYVQAGNPHGESLVLLHQTPRSWNEFAAMLPRLREYNVIVPDIPGYGGSTPVANTIESYGQSIFELIESLATAPVHILGHHFGGLVAYELASENPDFIRTMTLSSTPFVDGEERERRRDAPPFNWVRPREDGAHLAELWRKRRSFLSREMCEDSEASVGVLSRYVSDVINHKDPDSGHEAVRVYRSEDRLGAYSGPVLCVSSREDPRAFPLRHRIESAFPEAEVVVIDRGDISTPESCPDELARAMKIFHRKVSSK